ncbi:two component system response regulator [Erwiniaceae bacterium BAC15a-03b]|uniref:Two component system response regulator n=1 Tax=Winslowiella arboricola TaxID=2978220 RepID=A0A9J6PSE1_9GAMM|nr:two component system response regulator [Winslowiella arboricola]MCU5775528.1 two component system response regulator [Winslowiella arboricola]MCU5779622.1 two component system response regulator [Winslowiella arboricola]
MTDQKLLLVDDHQLIANGIISMLAPHPCFRIVAYINDGLAVYNACRRYQPDILLLDSSLPGINGLDILPTLHQRWPQMRIVVYSDSNEEHLAIRALCAGALAYVLKSSCQQVLLTGLQCVALNKEYIDPALNRAAIHNAIRKDLQPRQLLTPRERQILQMIAEGHSNRLIAEQLCISVKTVETHRLNIMSKLNVHKVTQLLSCSRRLGLTL